MAVTPSAQPAAPDPYRLPASARPRRYDVRLRPDLDDASFTGAVVITADTAETLDELVLNAAELEIAACTVDGVPATWELDGELERLRIRPTEPLPAGEHTLAIDFTGVLNDKLRGFYRSTYLDADGVEQVIATTQMQSTDCRRAFPCWDEPEFKAVFAVTLDVADGLTAISNAPEIEQRTAAGRTVVRFADTMVMSSYLVAFVVGRLEVSETVDVDGIPLRVVHVPGKGHLTDFALDCGAFCLRWFQDYYDIDYPGTKVDLVALPDFAAGAMENLGCITFRESLLLVDPEASTQTEQQLVADVVAHELAHMWFGDLVTMRWWNGIWLNEAFATFMEVAACDAYRPDWDRWTSFGTERSGAFDVDALVSTRSVEFEVRSPTDAEGMFDVLTYQKGGALLRMLEQYLGSDRFRDGVRHYLHTHAYANTETEDLWDALEATSGEPIRRIMDSWIWQPGFPLIEAEIADGSLRLAQRRFGFDVAAPDDGTTWGVPLHVRNGGRTSTLLLDRETGEQQLARPDGPVIVNAGGHGFVRVAYGDELRPRFDTDALAAMSTIERYGLVDDALAATTAGRMSATELLELLEQFRDERELTVWQAVATALRGIARVVPDRASGDALAQRVRDLVSPTYEGLGEPTERESDLTGKLRGLLTSTLGGLGDDPAVQARCRGWFADPSTVDPERLAAATSVVAMHGDADTFDRLVDGFTNGATPQDQLRHLYALAEFDDEELVVRACDFAMSGAVKTQNAPFLLNLAIGNRHHGPTAWAYVRDRWSEANERFPTNTIVRMVNSVKFLNTPELVADTHAFFEANPIPQATKTLEQLLERQRVNAAWRSRDAAALRGLLTG